MTTLFTLVIILTVLMMKKINHYANYANKFQYYELMLHTKIVKSLEYKNIQLTLDINTVSTISTLQDIHEEMELLQDLKIITASSTDGNEKRRVTAASNEI
ncbi:hypothetical protein M0802_003430 [Mischocyttarus mexicanus]|nr:hypothetical protein M0802_003430 [Mischocyttarus mexicanus]